MCILLKGALFFGNLCEIVYSTYTVWLFDRFSTVILGCDRSKTSGSAAWLACFCLSCNYTGWGGGLLRAEEGRGSSDRWWKFEHHDSIWWLVVVVTLANAKWYIGWQFNSYKQVNALTFIQYFTAATGSWLYFFLTRTSPVPHCKIRNMPPKKLILRWI